LKVKGFKVADFTDQISNTIIEELQILAGLKKFFQDYLRIYNQFHLKESPPSL
jgi:hypothetical protein